MTERRWCVVFLALLVGCSGSSSGDGDDREPDDAGLSTAGDATSASDAAVDHDSSAPGDGSDADGGAGDAGSALPVLTVDVTFPPATYTLQATTTPLALAWTSAVAATCRPSESGVETLAATSRTATSVTYANPTMAGNDVFALSCAAPAGYSGVTYSPSAAATVTVAEAPPCTASQVSSPLGTTTLKRLCSGKVDINGGASAVTYGGPLVDLATILATPAAPQPFPIYGHDGYAPTFTIDTGSYVAVAIHVTAPGSLHFTANPSYGVGGLIALSAVPGALTKGTPGAICAFDNGNSNILVASTAAGAGSCALVVGQTYFLNFAAVHADGSPACAAQQPTCRSSTVGYTVNESTDG